MKKIVLATKNKNKVIEVKSILKGSGIDVVSLDGFVEVCEVVEDGKTFSDNAKKKAKEISLFTGLPSIADDSGLCVDVLNGEPGVYSSRYAGDRASDNDNNEKLLSELKDVPKEKRKASFFCCMSVFDGEKEVYTATGECKGFIDNSERGANGFGYDPLFIPYGYSKTFAELGLEVKNKISHRKKALDKVKNFFNDNCFSSDYEKKI